MLIRWLAVLALLLSIPHPAFAAGDAGLQVPVWTVIPFVLTLLAIAVLPLALEHFWHRNWNRALVMLLLSLPVVLYLVTRPGQANLPHLPLGLDYILDRLPVPVQEVLQRTGTVALMHSLEEYFSFLVLLGSLYVVAGGIALTGDLRPGPLKNTLFLAVGAVLSNLIGTTGASMLLIRPYLRINQRRSRTVHLPVFFIFIVSNLSGLLTPLGDPPLFLGFLRGVPFEWTLQLWPQWACANGYVLVIFLLWDATTFFREPPEARTRVGDNPLRADGLINILFLAGILAAVLLKSPAISRLIGIEKIGYWAEGVMALMALLSWLVTRRRVREANEYSWGPILEVAILFAGIFVTMTPALALLQQHGQQFGLKEPWQLFWLTGILSSFLDNAPTYLVFASLAADGPEFARLADPANGKVLLLQAISCGAVFMGANTYIGNGPNFMVKAIANSMGFQTPSFFGYMLYSLGILLPLFVLITWIFFRPAWLL